MRSYGKAVLSASYIAEKAEFNWNEIFNFKKNFIKKTNEGISWREWNFVPISYSWKNLKEFPKLVNEVSYPVF